MDDLYKAAYEGDDEAIAQLKIFVNTPNKQDHTLLHIESNNGNRGHVRFILRKFADNNLLVKLSKSKMTALHFAARCGSTGVAKVLIEAARALHWDSSADYSTNHNTVTSFQDFLRQADKDGDTALHYAVEKGNLDIVTLLVEADNGDSHVQNNRGKTPIYIAVEKGYSTIVEVICKNCTAPSLKGPGGQTALHAAIKKLDQAKKENRDVIKMVIRVVKRLKISKDGDTRDNFDKLFLRPDEYGQTLFELAVEGNCAEVVEMILVENSCYQLFIKYHFIGLMPLIYKARDNKYEDIVRFLSERYDEGIKYLHFRNQVNLISAIGKRDRVSVASLLNNYGKDLVNFADNVLGWTALHYAAYHEFDSIISVIIDAQIRFGCHFVYKETGSTPFHIAAEKGFTSTVILLMKLWPPESSAYTAGDKNGQNILHLAALQSNKEMIKDILNYCPQEYKKEILNKQDKNGNTPFHLLNLRGCWVPEFINYEGLDIRVKNKEKWTPPGMLYFEDEIICDQVQIKMALDRIKIDQKRDIFSSSALSNSKRKTKNVIFKEQAKVMIHQKLAHMKQDTHAFADCFGDAIAGDAISKAALEMEADTPNKEGKTILHVESMRGNTEHVRYIVTEFASKNLLVQLDNQNQTALHLAVNQGHDKVVEVLIHAAENLPSSSANNQVSSFQTFMRAVGPEGNTAIHLAVLKGDVAIVQLLVDADRNDSHVKNDKGKTPIYIAAENGNNDIIKVICTCTALGLDGPDDSTTALHALIKNIQQGTEARDVITLFLDAAKRWSAAGASPVSFEALLNRINKTGSTLLQLAVEKNFVDAVDLILRKDPAYQNGLGSKKNGLMRLIFKAIDMKYSEEIVKLLSQAYEAKIDPHKGVLDLILAIKSRDKDTVLRLLENANILATFVEEEGWTPLHYAAYNEFVSVLHAIIDAQNSFADQFVYGDMIPTPLHVAAECGYTSTVIRLMQLWPASSSAYTSVNKNSQNILHLAAVENKKEMAQGILEYCPETDKHELLQQQDLNGNTPLHLLISNGCFIPELIKHKGLDLKAKNREKFTPRDMLYFEEEIIADQVQVKIALDDIQTSQSAWKCWGKNMEMKTDILESIVLPSIREKKDGLFYEGKKLLEDEKHGRMKKDLDMYKKRTNTQIIVAALITTVTFTVGFTMPGGFRQSGKDDDGLAVLSGKRGFKAFMILDAVALLFSTSSLFFYFLESLNKDRGQVSILNAASTVFNILSLMAMMSTFIAGTYVVLSDSPALAIAVCITGSLFFLLAIITWIVKIVYDRQVKKNKD